MRYEPGYEEQDTKKLNYYRHCKWCGGTGCLQCEAEADAAYNREFPNGLQPIATFKLPDELAAAKQIIGADALRQAFGPEGGGVREIIDNLQKHKSESAGGTVSDAP